MKYLNKSFPNSFDSPDYVKPHEPKIVYFKIKPEVNFVGLWTKKHMMPHLSHNVKKFKEIYLTSK